MFLSFIEAFCGVAPDLSLSNLPQCFAYFVSVICLIVALSVIFKGIFSLLSAAFRNKI